MIKLIHWFALRMSDTGRLLCSVGGSLELWCNERAARRKWMRWGKEHKLTVTWLPVSKDVDPSEIKMPSMWGQEWDDYVSSDSYVFKIPAPGEVDAYVPVKPRPFKGG